MRYEWNEISLPSSFHIVSLELEEVWLRLSVENILDHHKYADKQKDGYTKVLLSHHSAVGADPELLGQDVWST